MHLTKTLSLRRILNSGFHPFQVIPKPDVWMKRERLNRFTAWQYASERDTVKGAYRKEDKIFSYLSMQREDEQKLEKFHAEERVRTALAEHDMEYSKFKTVLSHSHILLDNICLSQLAIYEPRSFRSLVAFAKEIARQEGMDVIPDDPEFAYDVHVDNESVLRKPLPHAVEYTRGASENHTNKPRKLREDEY
uniref:Ribosomal protein L20 n=1 Tax=Caenorhabditis tropicalis TaxID=1561998 RepID=A0A1I7UUH5_9PELO